MQKLEKLYEQGKTFYKNAQIIAAAKFPAIKEIDLRDFAFCVSLETNEYFARFAF